jgi:hypothetical protein
MVHELYLTIMDRKLFFCPMGQSPQWVIDLGCGTGLWAIEMGTTTHIPMNLFEDVLTAVISGSISVSPGGFCCGNGLPVVVSLLRPA